MSWIDALRFDGGRVLITGAAGGIGRCLARGFAELDAQLLLIDRPGSDWAPVHAALVTTGGRAPQIIECDLEDQAARQRLIDAQFAEPAPLSALVNNAAFVGTSGLRGWAVPLGQQSVDTFRRALEVNLTAVFHLCQGLAPALARAPEGGAIVNIGSIYGALGPDWSLYEGTTMSNPAAYGASKGGVIQLTRWLATTLAPAVRVNAVSPGGILRGQPESFVRRYERRTPLGRMGTEDDIVGAVLHLASGWARYTTGQHLLVDGGWSAW
ncbi:SDR family oxidoreductase [Acidovorax lacteus]|uniref:SDR family NAD(P)-dependent oxidoreductase n=1 Tax=Acidovorax lacteus TaxID=1924988 RepID=A0ABP8LFG5_9BURK